MRALTGKLPRDKKTDRKQVQWSSPKTELGADPSAKAAAQDVPQSEPFRTPGLCPLEVQGGQLSVENKLLPCFQTLWQPNYNPQHTRPIPNLILHPTLFKAPSPFVFTCQNAKSENGRRHFSTSTELIQLLNTDTFGALFLTKRLHYALIKTLMYCHTK